MAHNEEEKEPARFFTNTKQNAADHVQALSSPSTSSKEHWQSIARELLEKCTQKLSSQDEEASTLSSLGTLYTGSLGPLVYLKWRMARLLLQAQKTDDAADDSSDDDEAKQLLQQALSLVDSQMSVFTNGSNKKENNPLTAKQHPRQNIVTLLEGSYVGCKALKAVLHYDLGEKEEATTLANELIEQLYDACFHLAVD